MSELSSVHTYYVRTSHAQDRRRESRAARQMMESAEAEARHRTSMLEAQLREAQIARQVQRLELSAAQSLQTLRVEADFVEQATSQALQSKVEQLRSQLVTVEEALARRFGGGLCQPGRQTDALADRASAFHPGSGASTGSGCRAVSLPSLRLAQPAGTACLGAPTAKPPPPQAVAASATGFMDRPATPSGPSLSGVAGSPSGLAIMARHTAMEARPSGARASGVASRASGPRQAGKCRCAPSRGRPRGRASQASRATRCV